MDIDDEAVADSEPGDPVPIADVGEDIEMEKQGEVDPDVGVFVLDGLAAAKAFSEKRGKTVRGSIYTVSLTSSVCCNQLQIINIQIHCNSNSRI